VWQITRVDDNNLTIAFDASGFGTAYDADTDPGTITTGVFYAAKEAVAMKDFTSGNAGATDHWGSTGVAAMMEAFAPQFESGGASGQRMGSGANQVLDEALYGAGWLLTGLGLPQDGDGIDASGSNLYGTDTYYQYIRDQLCLLSCSRWSVTSEAGVWVSDWYYYRVGTYNAAGFRCSCYPS
jgi:hypothetical protein